MKKHALLALVMVFVLSIAIMAQRQKSSFGNVGQQNQSKKSSVLKLPDDPSDDNNSSKFGTQKKKTDAFGNSTNSKGNKKKKSLTNDQSNVKDTTSIVTKDIAE